MTMGASGIPALRLQRLQKLIERFMTPPNLILMNLFGGDNWESDTIKWESQVGNRGLTPFVAPGAPAPATAPPGIAQHSALAAFWKEKIYYDESFLNNLRRAGTESQYMDASRRLARDMRMLRSRCDRRKEWMFSKMLTAGSFNYTVQGGYSIGVNYGIPAANQVTLAGLFRWGQANASIVSDIMDAKIFMQNSCGATLTHAMFTSEILKLMVLDPSILTILQKSAYGSGDLFARPVQVLGNLLDIPQMVVYDEQYQIKNYLTGPVVGGATTAIPVDDTADYEVGGTLTFVDVSAKTVESRAIASIQTAAGTVTVAVAPVASYSAREDFVYMNRKFIPPTSFTMFAAQVEGQKIAEFANAPFSIPRHYGMKVDQKQEWDPEGVYIRVQNKGIPVLYQADGVYQMTVV